MRLEPLQPEHVAPLYRIALKTPDEYRFTSTPVTEAQREVYFAKVFAERDAGRSFPFVMLHGGEIVGTTRLADYSATERNCELGYTWFDAAYFGTAVNTDSKLLMLTFALETLDVLRVQLTVDARNERSQASIKALGGVFEGVLRSHKVVKDGFVRDTLVFSILATEWASVKKRLQARLDKKLSEA
ncbi:GNAT family protein [soil metagenome]